MPLDANSAEFRGYCTIYCPNCGPNVMHQWSDLFVQYDNDGYVQPKDWVYVECMRCGNVSIWEDGK